MAPEMIRRCPYATAIDVWSLGAVAYESSHRHPPYYQLHPLKVLFSIATKGAPPLKKNKKYSPEFKDFLHKCFIMNPNERPSAKTLLEHPFLKKAAPKSKLVHSIHLVFLGNSIRMNGF